MTDTKIPIFGPRVAAQVDAAALSGKRLGQYLSGTPGTSIATAARLAARAKIITILALSVSTASPRIAERLRNYYQKSRRNPTTPRRDDHRHNQPLGGQTEKKEKNRPYNDSTTQKPERYKVALRGG